MYSLALIHGNIYQDGRFIYANLYVKDEKIVMITDSEEIHEAEESLDCTGKLILPGFIDSHVHFELDLGNFKSADNFFTGTKTAAYGGVTTIIDFLDPVNNESDFLGAYQKRSELAKKSCVDYSFHTTLGNFQGDLNSLIKQSLNVNIPTFKIFTTYSESNRKCSERIITEILERSNKGDILLLAHCEEDGLVNNSETDLANYEESRSVLAELTAVIKLAEICERKNGKLYIVHTSSGSTVEMLLEKFKKLIKKNIFIESCPQYFELTSDLYNTPVGNRYLLAPPLRSYQEKEKLKSKIKSVFSIGTDHCPFMTNEKDSVTNISKVPKGLGSIEYSFSLMYNLFGDNIIDRFTKNPAKIMGLKGKGTLDIDTDADIVIFDPDKEFVIGKGVSACDYSPYSGLKLKGKVESTILRGKFIVKKDQFFKIQGKILERCLSKDEESSK